MNWTHFFEGVEVVGLVAAVVAIVVGIYHLREIQRVANALSTRYLGKFPDFLPEIVALLKNARRTLVIFCDFPGYGDYSDPPWGREYRATLAQLKQRKGFTLEITCLNFDKRKDFLDAQFPPDDWENRQSNPKEREKALKFLNHHLDILKDQCEVVDPAKASRDDIVKVMDVVDTDILNDEFSGKGVPIDEAMPIYFWIADGRSAIFSIPALSKEALEYGFKTSDQALIKALMEVRMRYRKTTTVT